MSSTWMYGLSISTLTQSVRMKQRHFYPKMSSTVLIAFALLGIAIILLDVVLPYDYYYRLISMNTRVGLSLNITRLDALK